MTRDVTREFRDRVTARNGHAPKSWADWHESYYDEEREKFDEAGVERRANVPATVIGWALLGCLAVVVSAVVWGWIFS